MNKRNLNILAAIAVMAMSASSAGAQRGVQAAASHTSLSPLRLSEASSQMVKPVRVMKTQKKTAEAPSPFYGRTFYGSLINSTDWESVSIAAVPYGIYSFELNDNISPEPVFTGLSYKFQSGAYDGDRFVGVFVMDVMGGLNGARYITLDPAGKEELKNVMYDTSHGTYSLLPSVMAYNNIDNTIYSLQYNDALTGLNWCRYNTVYDWMDKIAAFRGKYNVLTLANTPDGEMYFINSYGDLYHIDRKNGRPARIGWTGVSPVAYTQSMTYDNRTGLFLWAAVTDDGCLLYSVDPQTADAQYVASFRKSEEFSSLYSLENAAKDAAPAIAKNLRIDFAQEGGSEATVSFDVPTTTFSGSPLSAAILNVWVDGENLKGVDAKPGEHVSLPVSLSEGNHYVAVNTRNGEGWSPLASLKQYAGYDTPLAVGDVQFTTGDDGNKVAWTAPAGGVNKGYIDNANLTYTIVRMPDSVTVADNYKSLHFEEPVPQALHAYSYRVYANNNGKRSACAESARLTCGDAFATPYSQGFASQQDFNDYFTVVDNNNDGSTWRFQEWGNIVRFDLSNDSRADDWLITPAISLDGGTSYSLSVNLKTFMKGYPEYFELLVGTDPKDVSTFRSIKNVEGLELYEDYSDYTTTFNTDAPGKYYIALRYLGEKAKNSSMLLVKGFAVKAVGKSKAPAAASDLKVVAGADDAMAATVSFTAPTADLNGNAIESIAKVNVYRNNEAEPVHVFDAPATGAKLSWTDTHVKKIGINVYSVKAANADGEGAAAADSAFVGCYTAPYLETFDTRSAAEFYTAVTEGVDEQNKDSYIWKYDSNNKRMNIYAFNSQADNTLSAWLITPLIRLDANSVYRLGYSKNFSAYTPTVSGNVYMGNATNVESLTTPVGAIEKNAGYGMEDGENTVVTADAGKYCFGFNIKGTAQYDNIMADFDNIGLTYVKSAFSPYRFTNLKATADAKGALAATIECNAPATDYQGTRLSGGLTVNVYRGNSSIPVFTRSDVVPGTEISWTDTEPQRGYNTYTVVAENGYGRSETATATLFVGIDRPAKVENLAIRGNEDNRKAVITWQAPAAGHNGGVVLADGLSYRVLQYNITDQTLAVVADDIKELAYTVDRSDLDRQEIVYYGVVAKNEVGIGDTLVTNCTIGKLYEMPFKESFAGRELSSSPWTVSTENSYVLNWGTACPAGGEGSYNLATPQDGDDGCAYFYNGSYYDTYAGAAFISPKVAVGGKQSVLSFWIYNYAPKYDKHPYVIVYVRADDSGDFTEVARYDVSTDDGSEGWKQYSVDLGAYKSSNFLNFAFYAFTDGHQECVYLDNVTVTEGTATGLSGLNGAKSVKSVEWFDLDGRRVNAPQKGVYVKTTVYADGSRNSQKVVK